MDRRVFKKRGTWDDLSSGFRWQVPTHFNMAMACCDSWAAVEPNRLALTHVAENGESTTFTYGTLRNASNGLGNAFRVRGLKKGDCCAVLLAQSPEVLITHFAAHKLGMVTLPLFTLFGEDGLEYRLKDSGARAVVTDHENLHKILNIKDKLSDLQVIWVTNGTHNDAYDFWADIGAASDQLTPVMTLAGDPAMIVYTSGTTGPPKGALHAHRFLLGHMPAIELQHEFFPQPGDVGWTPADWAWVGGLMNMAMSCLYYGVPLVSHRMMKFDPDRVFDLIGRRGIRNMFLPPTAVKMLRQGTVPKGFDVRTIMSGGESLGTDMLVWGQEALGLKINETYGQTECNFSITSAAGLGIQKAGAIGKEVPGFDVQIIDGDGNPVPRGEIGEMAVRRGPPVMFLKYWNQPKKTADKFIGDWMRTGDLGSMDEEGYITYSSRDDDVITSAGYRIGPTEIENCLTGHPDVVMAAAVGIPDPIRTEIVKAFVVLRPGKYGKDLKQALIQRVKDRVSPHCAPREIEIVSAMPMTATGKIMRRELRSGNWKS